MIIPFYKYHGTGNDFILVNQMLVGYLRNPDPGTILDICNRRFGVGADGLILLEKSERADFRMVYYNSDGNMSTMCGNGGRCLVHLAHELQLFKEECVFEAADGLHEARIHPNGVIDLKMQDVDGYSHEDEGYVIQTGSPHLVVLTEDLDGLDVVARGRTIRNRPRYRDDGINVNFIKIENDRITVRTYERGVEGETLSCGTGVTAAALLTPILSDRFENAKKLKVHTLGGRLSVAFDRTGSTYSNVWLSGPAVKVFEGQIEA